MATNTKYYEIYGELVKNKIFLQRLVIGLIAINIALAVVCYIAFTRPAQTFVIKDGYAYAANAYEYQRSVHEVRRFSEEFSKHLLEFNKVNFNDRIKTALTMCSEKLEFVMYNTIKSSNIPEIVKQTDETIRFQVGEIYVEEGEPYKVKVNGQQLFPGQAPLNMEFDLEVTTVSRSEDNPFGLKITNFKQSLR